MFNKKIFINGILMIGLPIVIQQVIALSLNMIDTFMIGSVGVYELAAVGASNKIYFIFSIICFGLYSGSTIFVSQYYGIKDIHSIRKVMKIELLIGITLSVFTTLITFFFKEQLLSLFTNDPKVITLGNEYLSIALFTYLPISISFAFSFNSRSIHQLKTITLISATAIMINTALNYGLIFGHFNFPTLGVQGAALATLIARLVELIFILTYIYRTENHPLAIPIKSGLSIDFTLMKKILSTSIPVIISESAWSIGITTCFIAYGLLGTSALAVVQVAGSINDLFQCIFFGLGNAAAVMIGNELGKNNKNMAYEYGKKFITINLCLCLFMTIALLSLRDLITTVYSYDPVTTTLLNQSLLVYALYITPKMMSYVQICGVLRSGGDTRFCMVWDVLSIWCVSVPLAFISVLVFKLPLPLVIAISFLDEIVKACATLHRFFSKKWIHNVIKTS